MSFSEADALADDIEETAEEDRADVEQDDQPPSVAEPEPARAVDLISIPTDDVVTVWPAIEVLIRRAAEQSGGRYTVSDYLDMVLAQEAQLWVGVDARTDESVAVLITEIITYRAGLKVCGTLALAGIGRKRWVHFLKVVEAWAEEQGCHSMELPVRKGWARVLTDYRMTHCILEKHLGVDTGYEETD